MALRILCLILACGMILFGGLKVQAAPVQIGMLHFPPYYVLENDSKIVGGYYVDMLKQMFEKANVEYVMNGYPAKRLYSQVGDGTTHLWMGTIGVPDYEGKTLVSPKQTSEINMEVYTLGTANPLPKTVDELKGKSVVVIAGYNYGGLLKFLQNPENKITVMETKNHDLGFKMLQAERAPFMMGYKEPANEALAATKVPNLVRSSLKVLPIYINISKTLPDAQALMDKLMKAYDELKAEGKFK